ncbi:MAG: hypothetical protein HYY14_03090 [Candidatus Omnitrophica bacterium]|nr:hypothetical protein [Candidatus Omnitrophota bacterium]
MKATSRIYRLAAAVLSAFVIASQIEGPLASPVEEKGNDMEMYKVIPDSASIILRATHILLVRVEEVKKGPPAREADAGLVTERLRLKLALEETLKGRTTEPGGTVLDVEVLQHSLPTGRIAALPGVWSGWDVKPGTRLIAFCVGAELSAAKLLADPNIQKLKGAQESLTGVRLALGAEGKNLSPNALLDAAASESAELDELFADYFWCRLEAPALKDFKTFDAVANLIERPDLSPSFCAMLLDSVNASLAASDTVPAGHVHRLAVLFFRLCALKTAREVHDDIVGTYLPALLHLEDPDETPLKPSEVFKDYPTDRPRALKALAGYRGDQADYAAQIIDWLR